MYRRPDLASGPAVRTIAIDWSGALVGGERRIWIAEAEDGALARLECGRSRAEVAQWLLAETADERAAHSSSAASARTVVGMDFAFSMPRWFLEERGLTAPTLWAAAARDGEAWLRDCAPPFWGRPGRRRTDIRPGLRGTDLDARIGGVGAKSVFQIGGAGAVGTGSIRGMPMLARLHDAGFRIWPFCEDGWPRVVEIYPRLATGAVRKSDRGARAAYIAQRAPHMSAEHAALCAGSEDAFDAAVSALVMARDAAVLAGLRRTTCPTIMLEGAIWRPEAEL
ncbi:MAG: DUF429 domain-containing protein [Chloroflexi bacterium]|nr:DUF429 domain-containing protein [Chloroflexota bacterium]